MASSKQGHTRGRGSAGNIRDLHIAVRRGGHDTPIAQQQPQSSGPDNASAGDPSPVKPARKDIISPHRRKKLVVIGNVTLYEHQFFNIINCVFGMESRVNWKTMDVAIIMLKPVTACLQFVKRARSSNSKLFILVIDSDANESASLREECFRFGANMVTCCPDSVSHVLNLIGREGNPPGPYSCPYCKMSDLSEDDLWTHCPLFHINDISSHQHTCPVCGVPPTEQKKNFQAHLRNHHGPVARQEILPEIRVGVPTHAFALVVCHRVRDNKFLVVQEFGNAGFWLPGGMATPGETLMDAAIRETLEEAGIYVNLVGVLRIEHSVYNNTQVYNRMRVIFYAHPVDASVRPKSLPDYQSAGACWVDVEELERIKLRGTEPQEWFPYILNNGEIYPISILECWKHEGGRGRKQTGSTAPSLVPRSISKAKSLGEDDGMAGSGRRSSLHRQDGLPRPQSEPVANGHGEIVSSGFSPRSGYKSANGSAMQESRIHTSVRSPVHGSQPFQSLLHSGMADEILQEDEARGDFAFEGEEHPEGRGFVSSPGEHRKNRSVRYVPRNEPKGRIALRTSRRQRTNGTVGRQPRVGKLRY